MKKIEPRGGADPGGYAHAGLTGAIIECYFDVYNELGHGFVESVYKRAMRIALETRGLRARSELPIQVAFRGVIVGDFCADLLVNETVIVELKAARALDSSHEAQLLNYLRATDKEVGLLLNFGPQPLVRRFAYSNRRKVAAAALSGVR